MPRILIGYSMRSGSTLLQHILGQHSRIYSYSDLSSVPKLAQLKAGRQFDDHVCIKPMDVVYLRRRPTLEPDFDKRIWLARDPRDSYLSARSSGYAYLLWPPGRKVHGIDVGLLRRWKRIYRRYFEHTDQWHLVKYESLVCDPDRVIGELFDYLELPTESLLPFEPFQMRKGGDYKLAQTRTVSPQSVGRHQERLTAEQQDLFREYCGDEMAALDYL